MNVHDAFLNRYSKTFIKHINNDDGIVDRSDVYTSYKIVNSNDNNIIAHVYEFNNEDVSILSKNNKDTINNALVVAQFYYKKLSNNTVMLDGKPILKNEFDTYMINLLNQYAYGIKKRKVTKSKKQRKIKKKSKTFRRFA